jgi:hypothetical protein
VLRAAITLLLSLTPAQAQEEGPNIDPAAQAEPGPVALVMLAHDLHAIGVARGDALTVLAAARLAAGVTLTSVERAPVKGAAAEADPGPAPVDAARMLADARALAGEDELLSDLVDEAQAEAAQAARATVSASGATLGPGESADWQVAFFGAVNAEVAVLGDGPANLDLTVTDEKGTLVCTGSSTLPRAYCDVVPRWNGYFTLTVQNRSDTPAAFTLLTN